jgi:hypothetical protein
MPQYNVYNYAVHGYGPQNMLALLETGRLPREVQTNQGVAVYYFGGWDFDRAVGSMVSPWTFELPYYRLDENGRLVRNGSFKTGRPIVTRLYEWLNMAKDYSSFLQLINFRVPPEPTKQDVLLTAAIVKRAKELYEHQFAGRFYLLMNSLEDPKDTRLQEFSRILQEGGVEVLYYPKTDKRYEYTIKSDGHPNQKLSEFVATNLVRDLRF